ncbi:MAG: hypothetical protein JNJ52_06015 [Flavobacterium sp.]|nr:hypothetical protein [Flavobacterium sp.]
MIIDLKTSASRKEIVNVRSQITNSTQLKSFDDFVARNSTFDFNNDEHVSALRSNKNDCHCTVNPTVDIKAV